MEDWGQASNIKSKKQKQKQVLEMGKLYRQRTSGPLQYSTGKAWGQKGRDYRQRDLWTLSI